MHVEQHDVGLEFRDAAHRVLDGGRVPEHVDQPVQLGLHAGAEELVVVDDDDAGHPSTSSTSVPWPGREWTVAVPPWRSMRPTIESRTPRRSAGTSSGANPGPRSRTNTSKRPSSTSAYRAIGSGPANFDALTSASRAAATSAAAFSSSGASPTVTTSIGT